MEASPTLPSPLVQMRREMAHPVATKADMAMLFSFG